MHMSKQDRIRKLLPSVALLLLLFTNTASANTCPSLSGELRELEHDVGGSITISEDCTLSVTGFSYDGLAPQVYWWGAEDCSAGTLAKEGARISNEQLVESYTNGEFSIPLLEDLDWSTIGCISVYCESFDANMGDLSFTPIDVQQAEPSTDTSTDTPSSSPSLSTYESVDELSSCTELIPGYYNLHWQIDDATNTLGLGLEGLPGTADTWLGFGFSAPDATGSEMVGSDVIVAGMIKGECFAYPYFLSAQSQCDFETGDGVCPDFAGTEPLVPSTSIDVLSCEKEGDKLSILMTTPLGDAAGDESIAWPVDGSRFSIFAMGPVSEGSNATIPVVLYHSLQLPGTSAPASINNAGFGENSLKIDLSATENNCKAIASTTATSPSSAPSPSAEPAATNGQVATIDGPTTFDVTIGTNENYPNPPAWGLSLWVNDEESPVLVVRRGTPYTFNIEAGPTHPVYITDSIIGGGLLEDYEGETIFAGNDTTFGEPGDPVSFTWTPDESTPDLVYYQCVVHQKLGWEIRVVDADSDLEAAAGPSIASAPAPADADAEALAPSDGSSSDATRCTTMATTLLAALILLVALSYN